VVRVDSPPDWCSRGCRVCIPGLVLEIVVGSESWGACKGLVHFYVRSTDVPAIKSYLETQKQLFRMQEEHQRMDSVR
jgi:hypothetical protein